MALDVNEKNKKGSGRDWLSVLLPIGTLVLGAFLGPAVQRYYDEYKVVPMLQQLSEEVFYNKNSVEQIPQYTESFMNTVQSGRKDALIGTFLVQDDVYKSYLGQMDLLDDNTRTDLTLYYLQLQAVQDVGQSLQQVTEDYDTNQPYAKSASVTTMGNNFIQSALLAVDEASILQAELLVTDNANTPSYIKEDYLASIKPAVINYLDNTTGTIISFDAVKQAAGDSEGLATAVLLLRQGLTIDHPLSNLEFQR
jgi:hypothetical protein